MTQRGRQTMVSGCRTSINKSPGWVREGRVAGTAISQAAARVLRRRNDIVESR